MPFPLRITFRDMPPSDALETYVRERASKLERFYDRITSCQVTIEMPHRHQHTSPHFRVAVDMAVPGGQVVVSRSPGDDPENHDAYAAIDQAFDQAVRRLQDYARQQRGDVKPHEDAYRVGEVTKLWTHEGYGFITSPDDYEVYFHEHSVLNNGFRRMRLGSKVRFVEELGDKGPQASTVVLVD